MQELGEEAPMVILQLNAYSMSMPIDRIKGNHCCPQGDQQSQ